MSSINDKKRKELSKTLRLLTFVTQFGLSLIMPLLICILVCVLLTNKLNVGGWVYIPGFIFGLGSSFMTAYKFYLLESAKSQKDKDKQKINYNRHL